MLLRQMKSLFHIVVAAAMGVGLLAAQTQDTTGNGLLKGTYSFRHLAIQIVNATNDPTDMTAVYGTITFDGAGNYSMTATSIDNGVSGGAPQAITQNGTYAIGANGAGYIVNELYPSDANALIYGAVAQGVYTGSSTESQQDGNVLNDIFIAIPTGAAPTNASFTSSYQTGLIDFPGANSNTIKNALFELVPDGKGNFGAISLNGQEEDQSSSTNCAAGGLCFAQTVTGATYNFGSNGSATLTIPAPSGGSATTDPLFTGSKTMYQSADGNFILGWTSTGFDIFFGVKALAAPGTTTLSGGLYFTAALEDFPGSGADSYYGGTNNSGDFNGDGVIHQRLNVPSQLSEDYGSDDQIVVNSDGTAGPDYLNYSYIFGDGENAYVAIGSGGFFSLVVGMHAPNFTPTGSVWLNPIGVNNAASFAPVTASLAPGEDIALYGSGLSSTTTNVQGGSPFPATLGGVTVTIDGTPAPIYSVSPTQLNVVVPYEVAQNTTGLANIQVNNNGTMSNVVQMYLNDSEPGSFSQTQNGIGLAAALHNADNSLITDDNSAQPGEYISLYLTGLGTVTPTVQDGAVGPSSPLSYSDLYNAGYLGVYFNDYGADSLFNPGNIQFAGLVPTLAGLYQINVQVPSSVLQPGDDVYVEFITDAADVNQIQIPYDFGGSARPASAANRRMARLKARITHARKVKHQPRAAALAAEHKQP